MSISPSPSEDELHIFLPFGQYFMKVKRTLRERLGGRGSGRGGGGGEEKWNGSRRGSGEERADGDGVGGLGGGGRRGALRNWAPQSSSLIFVLLFDVFYVPCWAAGVLADRDHNPVQLLSSEL